jgi:lipopolysaccharide transport system permease protein
MSEIIKIKPSGSWINLDLKELWKYRELLYFLTLRDIQIRYKQTFFGVFWAILQPVLTTAIFTVIFTNFARFDSNSVPYPLLALSGVLLWFFVNYAITNAGNSLINNTNLVTKVYFPRLIVPISATLAGLIDLVIGIALLIILMLYYGVSVSGQIIFAPLFIGLAVIFAISLGIMFAALNVRFRDIKHALPFALQVLMFASPVFYTSENMSEKMRYILSFNPLSGILQGFRSSLFGTPFDWFAITISVSVTLILLIVSLFIFKRMENDFADLI